MKCALQQLGRILMVWGLTLAWGPAKAALDFEDAVFPEFVTSARGLAMGNAYINKTDDAWSAFYNPAGLGTVRAPQFHLLNMHLEASNGYFDAVDTGVITNLPSNIMNSFQTQDLRADLVKNPGDIAHLRANFFPNITVRGMTIGYFLSQRNRAVIDAPVTTSNFEIAERRDHGPVFALNLPLFGGVFKIGASAKYVIREQLYKSFAPADPVTINDSDYQKGKSLQVTAGTKLTIPIVGLPTIGAVLRNSTNNDWEDTSANGGPARIKQTVDLGFSITPQIANITRLHLEFNLKDVGDAYKTSASRRSAFGAELDFSRSIFIRGGYGDGWGSGGIGVRNRTFIMDLTTYAVDRSLTGFRKQEDRRYVLSLSSGI